MRNNIFINYRREDSTGYSLAVYNELTKWYHPEMIFKDFNTIEPGEDFEESIDNALGSCTILLVLIGDSWMDILKKREEKKNDPDFVRIEIATALAKGIYTIPIVISGVEMLDEAHLPDDIKKITKRQYLHLDPARFDTDIMKLVKVIDKKLNIDRGSTSGPNKTSNQFQQTAAPKAATSTAKYTAANDTAAGYPDEIFKANFKVWIKFLSIAAAILIILMLFVRYGKLE